MPSGPKKLQKYAKWQMWVARCVASLLASGKVPGSEKRRV
jgi:hypothetical protein